MTTTNYIDELAATHPSWDYDPADDGLTYDPQEEWPETYELHDSHGAPQAGCEILSFEFLEDLLEHLDNNPDVMERLDEGYATIIER